MKTLRRYLNPPAVHMGTHMNEMCDHMTHLTEECLTCTVSYESHGGFMKSFERIALVIGWTVFVITVSIPLIAFVVELSAIPTH